MDKSTKRFSNSLTGAAMATALFVVAAVPIVPTVQAVQAADERDDRRAEMRERMKARFEENFQKRDTNGDGVISKQEVEDTLRQHFSTLDPNADGVISFDELPKVLPDTERSLMRTERRKKMAQRFAEKSGREIDEDLIEQRGQVTRAKFMARFDIDADEAVTFEEFARAPYRRFEMADANGDGIVTKDEAMEAARKGMKRMRKRRGGGGRGGWGGRS